MSNKLSRPKFTRIKGDISEVRRLPRNGKIGLGVKEEKNGKEFPKETDHFVCPAEVQAVYGEQPTQLPVLLPSDDPTLIFPQKLAMYKAAGLYCHGDGETAERRVDLSLTNTVPWTQRSCPCEHQRTQENPKGQCHPVAHLMVILPEINMGGVYQLTTSSWNSIVDINSSLDFVRGLLGRIAMVPLLLRRVAKEIQGRTHWPCTLTLDADLESLNQLRADTTRVLSSTHYQIEAPTDELVALPEPAAEPIVEREAPPDSSAAHLFWKTWLDEMQVRQVDLRPHLEKFHVTTLDDLPEDQREAFRLTVNDALNQPTPAPRSRKRRGVQVG